MLGTVAMTVLGYAVPCAQETRRTFRIGILSGLSRQAPNWVAFFDEVGKAGFVEGKTLIVDWRIFASHPEQSTALAAELAQLAPDVLLAMGAPAIVPARAATRTIPILGVADDMVASGLVPRLPVRAGT
jgi:putative ABC transport system substrate-binding protein